MFMQNSVILPCRKSTLGESAASTPPSPLVVLSRKSLMSALCTVRSHWMGEAGEPGDLAALGVLGVMARGAGIGTRLLLLSQSSSPSPTEAFSSTIVFIPECISFALVTLLPRLPAAGAAAARPLSPPAFALLLSSEYPLSSEIVSASSLTAIRPSSSSSSSSSPSESASPPAPGPSVSGRCAPLGDEVAAAAAAAAAGCCFSFRSTIVDEVEEDLVENWLLSGETLAPESISTESPVERRSFVFAASAAATAAEQLFGGPESHASAAPEGRMR